MSIPFLAAIIIVIGGIVSLYWLARQLDKRMQEQWRWSEILEKWIRHDGFTVVPYYPEGDTVRRGWKVKAPHGVHENMAYNPIMQTVFGDACSAMERVDKAWPLSESDLIMW